MGGRIEIIDHTADVGIRVWGRTGSELFETAATGMMSLILDREAVQDREMMTIHLEENTEEELLLRWLREILYVMEREGMVFRDVCVEQDNFSLSDAPKYYIYATLRGEKQDSSRHGICTEIKAVTRHGLMLRRDSEWSARVLFDV